MHEHMEGLDMAAEVWPRGKKQPQVRWALVLLKAEKRGEVIPDATRQKYTPAIWEQARKELDAEEANAGRDFVENAN